MNQYEEDALFVAVYQLALLWLKTMNLLILRHITLATRLAGI